MIETPDYPAIARGYAEACVSGKIAVCRWVRMAAKRFLKMLALAEKPGNPFYFSAAHACDYCSFLEKLEHVEDGRWQFTQVREDGSVDRSIVLEPWQIFVECAIQGFRKRATHERLVVRAFLMVPRKNAKTLLSAGAGLFDLFFAGNMKPQVVITASNEAQCDLVFKPMRTMLGALPEISEQITFKSTSGYIKNFDNNGEITKLSSMGEKNDGLNPSLAILEELHAQKGGMYRVIRSAVDARPSALLRMITTAGVNAQGDAYEIQQEMEQILLDSDAGKDEDFTVFACIYTLDREDYMDAAGNLLQDRLLSDLRLVAKANPMFGIGLDPDKILAQMAEARRTASKRGEFFRTRYNIWTNQGHALIEMTAWAQCAKPIELHDFAGQRCWLGGDLAIYHDMAALGLIFEVEDKIVLFAKHYLPEQAEIVTSPSLHGSIAAWRESGHLTVTPGYTMDMEIVERDIVLFHEVFNVALTGIDPQYATQLMHALEGRGIATIKYTKNARNFTAPTDDLVGRIHGGKVIHDGNPVLGWNMSNVIATRGVNDSLLPKKPGGNSERKIDGFDAVTIANGLRLDPGLRAQLNLAPVSVYETRGLLGS